MIQYQTILFCTDFSEDANIAFYHAVDLAKRYNAKLHIIHVLHSIHRYMPSETDEGTDNGSVTDASPDILAKVEQKVRQQYEPQLEGLTDVEYIIKVGTPFVEILRWARDHKPDIIIMGALGTSELEQTHYGSTVEQVSRRAPCHVMAIRNPEKTYTL